MERGREGRRWLADADVKGSGLERELGPEGLVAYQQLQSIYLPAPSAG